MVIFLEIHQFSFDSMKIGGSRTTEFTPRMIMKNESNTQFPSESEANGRVKQNYSTKKNGILQEFFFPKSLPKDDINVLIIKFLLPTFMIGQTHKPCASHMINKSC